MSKTFKEQLQMLVEGVQQLCGLGCSSCPLYLDPGCGAMLHWDTFDVDAVIASVPECAQLQTDETFKAELRELANDAHEICIGVAHKRCSNCELNADQRCGGALHIRSNDVDTLLAAIAEWRNHNITKVNEGRKDGTQMKYYAIYSKRDDSISGAISSSALDEWRTAHPVSYNWFTKSNNLHEISSDVYDLIASVFSEIRQSEVHWIHDSECRVTRCPKCNWSIETCISHGEEYPFCPNCGQPMSRKKDTVAGGTER